MSRPILSVVTVNYNNRVRLFQTVECVKFWRSQNAGMIEYIIVDGGSGDLDNSDLVKLREASDIFLYEQDSGIYDAMNKGLRAAAGEYIYFLNSGDLLFNVNVILQKIRIEIESSQRAVLVFRTLQTLKNIGWERPKRNLLTKLEKICAHQGTIVPLDETRGIEFDVSRPISADSLWLQECIRSRSAKVFIEIVAIFRLGGISNEATFKAQVMVYKDAPSLKRFLILCIKPILLIFLGYKTYFRVIYFFKYTYISDVNLYLIEQSTDPLLINMVNLNM